jgi:hypothetical protein
MSPSLLDFLRHIEHECAYLVQLSRVSHHLSIQTELVWQGFPQGSWLCGFGRPSGCLHFKHLGLHSLVDLLRAFALNGCSFKAKGGFKTHLVKFIYCEDFHRWIILPCQRTAAKVQA